jgi:hypothetical protein
MTLIRPIVTYGCETWTLSVWGVNSLLILRRLHGAAHTEEVWRIGNNDE